MCGICGVFGRSDVDTVKTMLSTLRHRGPDDEHLVEGDGFCLGTRRLSIVDVEGGRQPMSNEYGDVWVVCNGEIYNSPWLRAWLTAKGHVFRTMSDTEAIVHTYERDGQGFQSWLDGMFAIALWDNARGRGVLVRDRVGKKPMYYTERDERLYFASEIKALLRVPGFERKLNLEAMHYYLSYKHVPCPLTIFDGIHALPPAHELVFSLDNRVLQPRRYWKANWYPNPRLVDVNDDQVADELHRTLRGAVKRRLMSDVPVGFLLSGGVDSGLVTALAAGVSDKVRTFTLTYPDDDSALEGKRLDRDNARRIAQLYSTEHHEEVVDYPDFETEFPDILRCFDEPFAGVVSTYFLSRLIRKHVKVAVTGDGADELFGSYLSHRLAADEDGCNRWTHQMARNGMGDDWSWRHELLVFTDVEKERMYAPDLAEYLVVHADTRTHLRRYFEKLTARDPLSRMLEAEFGGIFPDQVLAFTDRLSMAHSLELRAAYLDTEFVELAAGIPGRMKISGNGTKVILKRVARRCLPPDIVHRDKEGFILPVTEWLHGRLAGYVRETLSVDALRRHGLFRPERVREVVDSFLGNQYDYRRGNKVLSLLAFQVWYDLYMGGRE